MRDRLSEQRIVNLVSAYRDHTAAVALAAPYDTSLKASRASCTPTAPAEWDGSGTLTTS